MQDIKFETGDTKNEENTFFPVSAAIIPVLNLGNTGGSWYDLMWFDDDMLCLWQWRK